ncbi:Subtilisin-like protease SBT3.3 [Cucurbita argyrosperma subsp. argyrosperma]|nr:Subtilisin-like protease SBT3.3 [Cucurbita argyrosperma subsp. argyrosperma]
MGSFAHGKSSSTTIFLVCISVFTALDHLCTLHIRVAAKSNVYIVYMGQKPHDNEELLVKAHHGVLASVLGSQEGSVDSLVYSYKYGFSGFAAKLTMAQAQMISELPSVVEVIPNRLHKMQTTRSWDYLQLSPRFPNSLLRKSRMGSGAIIGVLDTGIWPESEVFCDEGLGPVPSRWKGICESGELFSPAKACSRKLIGARYFVKGLEAAYGHPLNNSEFQDYWSPRDRSGHGTHVSSVASGFFVPNVSYHGLAVGTVRGGAPHSRIAMYKVCWQVNGGVCADIDILKAIDQAIYDGVDVLSLSLGPSFPSYSDVDMRNGIAIGAFHAVAKGIVVVGAAGNSGPAAYSVSNIEPWLLTVAASSVDRSFLVAITLGNNWTTMGQGMFSGKLTKFHNLVYPEVSDLDDERACESLSLNDTWAAGNVVLCFASDDYNDDTHNTSSSVKKVGGLGLIVAKNPTKAVEPFINNFPCVQISLDIGMQILNYIRSTRNPQVKIGASTTRVGQPLSTTVAYFSSRGPNSVAPAILKPDIAAPGVAILAAVPPSDPKDRNSYAFISGTSMATPHVSAIVALLKTLHSHWSPAAIKSAIVTTAWSSDPYGAVIFAEGQPMMSARPFDFGGGIVNPNKAVDPGLVYDMGMADYIQYFCAKGYNDSAISGITKRSISCPKRRPSILDINVPSITIPSLTHPVSLTRTVTNVGAINSSYKAAIEAPPGITIAIKPRILKFNHKMKSISFTVTISSNHRVTTGYCFGSLTWLDGVHSVRIPVSVRTNI